MKRLLHPALMTWAIVLLVSDGCLAASSRSKDESWREALVRDFASSPSQAVAKTLRRFPVARQELAVVTDWVMQDKLDSPQGLQIAAIGRIVEKLGSSGAELRHRCEQAVREKVPTVDRRWAELYLDACIEHRRARLATHRLKMERIVFTKHYDMGGSHYAYTEGQSDAQAERHFKPGSSLCLLELGDIFDKDKSPGFLKSRGLGTVVHTLVDDPKGVIRDPDVSYDGKRILFAWKKSLNEDDYHLYEMDRASRKVRQLTFGLGFADYEGVYLPNGEIIFNSSRCVQTVDCWWTEVSNLYVCDGDGRYLRRLSYDQVHTNYPMVTHDGRVIYTRWDYNDRGQIYPQGLFQMNPDGTAQREFYGNNSWFPTTVLHARSIPGTQKVVCVFSGHHTRQRGWLGILDPAGGRQENSGTQLIAPVRKTEAVHVDKYGQSGDQFQYPYPLSQTEFLVTFKPEGARHFAIYFMTADGERELLASDPKISCNQPVPATPRPVPPDRSNLVDHRKQDGSIYLHDIYAGEGLPGVGRDTIKSLRVVALEFRAAGVGRNVNRGPAGGAMASTPVSIEGTWDVKRVLGTAKVHADGSACFTVPAQTPFYFQALDAKGHAVQSMRSWVTLQPGEHLSCVGCHESKNAAPPVSRATQALMAGPQELTPWYGKPRGFSFQREVQPVLDRHCTGCHYVDEQTKANSDDAAFSLKDRRTFDSGSLRKWSDAYKALANRKVTNWINIQSAPSMLPPYHAGAAKSKLIEILQQGHYKVQLAPEEMDRLVTWIDLLVPFYGDYREDLEGKHLEKYQHFLDKRLRWEAQEAKNIAELIRTGGE